MSNVPQVQSAEGYDFDALVKWYRDLRQYRKELQESIDPQLNFAKEQMEVIEAEFNKRFNSMGSVNSVRTAYGTVMRSKETKYSVADKFAFREWIVKNPEDGVNLVSATLTQSEVSNFVEMSKVIPDGLSFDTVYKIAVRKS